jgi:superfamily II DNA or RNA helicase
VTLQDLIRHDKPLRTGATAVYPYSPKLERQYRFTSRFGDEVLLHARDGGELHLPRALCPVAPVDQRSDGAPASFPRCPELRPDQHDWFEATARFLGQGLSGVTVAGTGRGKTVCGYFAARHVGRRTLVIATKDDIYRQWLDGAATFLGLPKDRIGEIRQGKCEVDGRDFVVAMIHSLAKGEKYPAWIRDAFGLVIFDETHRVAAEQFQVVASMFTARLRLGLSATPERADGKELLVFAHVGPIRVRATAQLMVPKVLRFHSSWQCPRTVRVNPATGQKRVTRIPHEPGKTTHIEKILAADPERNRLLGELIHTAYRKGRRIVVFSTLHEHLRSLHRLLTQIGISGREIGFYIGATTKAEKAARERAKVRPILLTTYGMMGEGTDIPWLDLGLMAIPRSRVEQPCGRIRREYPDKPDPVWMDVVDDDSPVFSGYASSRLEWYRRVGAVVRQPGWKPA